MDEMTKLLDSKGNWLTLRQTIVDIISKNKNFPRPKQVLSIPFHGIYLKSFIGIEENSTFLDDDETLLNVSKLHLISSQIEEIKALQKPILMLWEVHAYVFFF